MSDDLRETPFVIVHIDGVDRRIPVGPNGLTIGRSDDVDLRINDGKVSGHHAKIVLLPTGYTLLDLHSRNGIAVAGIKIKEHLLRPGEEFVVGDTTLRWGSVDPKPAPPPLARKSRIFPTGRAVYATTVCLLLATLAATVFHFGVDSARDHWGVARKLESVLGNAIADITNRREEPSKRPSPEKAPVVAERPSTPRSEPEPDAPGGNDFAELAIKAMELLRAEVAQALAEGDIARAEKALAAGEAISDDRASPFRNMHFLELLDKQVAEVKRARAVAERERLAGIERQWKEIEDRVKTLIAAEQFDEAGDVLLACADPRAPALAAAIDKAREDHIAQRMPERRDVFATLVLRLRPFLAKRDYAGASRMLDALANDSLFKPHRPLLEREKETLAKADALYREILDAVRRIPKGTKIVIEQTNAPTLDGKLTEVNDLLWLDYARGARISAVTMKCLVALASSQSPNGQDASDHPGTGDPLGRPYMIANLYLYDGDFASASLAAIDLAGTDLAAVSDFFIRMDLFQKALIGEEIRDAFARADKYVADGKPAMANDLLKALAQRYAVPTMEGVSLPETSSLPEGIALHDGRLPQLDAIAKKREEIQAKITIGNIPYHRLKILGEKGRTDEKLTLLKSLKVIGGREILPYVTRALDDDAARVRLEGTERGGDRHREVEVEERGECAGERPQNRAFRRRRGGHRLCPGGHQAYGGRRAAG